MIEPKLFAKLPEYVTTPDGMAIDAEGNLILACPNYAEIYAKKPGCILKIDKDRNIRKWVDVPVHPETGYAFPMGIAFGPDGDLYVVDNQGWSGKPELLEKGRILRLRIKDDMVIKCTVVAYNMEHPNGMRIKDGYVYVTQSMLPRVKDPSGKLVSCVYKFALDDEGTMIFDTPGFTAFDILTADAEELQFLYPEIGAFAGQCRYDNCRHLAEPECEIKKAVEADYKSKFKGKVKTIEFYIKPEDKAVYYVINGDFSDKIEL
jgi:sugar lactone lactonase YvrE